MKNVRDSNLIEKVGIYSALAGLIEVGFGSTINAIRLPLKGHILSGLQNFLLILFGKDLKGKGLFSITILTTLLKIFSPISSRLKSMLGIFIQGSLFSLPIHIFGWNFLTVIIGSILLSVSSIFISLFVDYITYGSTVFLAYENMINKTLSFLNIINSHLAFADIILLMVLLKAIMGVLLATIAYYCSFSKLLNKYQEKLSKIIPEQEEFSFKELPSFKESIKASFKDLTAKRFLISFAIIVTLIYILTPVSTTKFLLISVRALFLSWLGLLLARRIDFNKIIKYLESKKLTILSSSLQKSLQIFFKLRKGLSS